MLSGHIHRHQVLRAPGGPAVVYAGSVERTSFAEAGEPKGAVVVELASTGVAAIEFRPLPARPMVICRLSLAYLCAEQARAQLERAVRATPADAATAPQRRSRRPARARSPARATRSRR